MKIIPVLSLSVIICFSACNRKISAITGLRLLSESSVPGELMTISFGKTEKTNNKSLGVTVGGQSADLVAVEENSIDFIVPEMEPGRTEVKVFRNNKTVGSTALLIVAHPTRKIIFSYQKDEIVKLGEKLTNDELATRENSEGRKILFELFDTTQKLLVSGIVVHPLSGMELFEDPKGKIRKENKMDMGPGTFSVNVPNIHDPMQIKFYDLFLKGDTSNLKQLESRKFITEIKL